MNASRAGYEYVHFYKELAMPYLTIKKADHEAELKKAYYEIEKLKRENIELREQNLQLREFIRKLEQRLSKVEDVSALVLEHIKSEKKSHLLEQPNLPLILVDNV